MTENLAGRGEGLAGLVAQRIKECRETAERWRTESRIVRINRAIGKDYANQLDALASLLETALEAAAPPSTAHDRNAWGLRFKGTVKEPIDAWRWQADDEDHLASLANNALVLIRAADLRALATPSPQAPAGDRTFSPTELTHLRMATASGSPECICEIERLGNFGHYKRWRDKNCLVHGEKAKEGK